MEREFEGKLQEFINVFYMWQKNIQEEMGELPDHWDEAQQLFQDILHNVACDLNSNQKICQKTIHSFKLNRFS